jgi:hypothetical protein
MCTVNARKAHAHKISYIKGMLKIQCKTMYEKYLGLLVHVGQIQNRGICILKR